MFASSSFLFPTPNKLPAHFIEIGFYTIGLNLDVIITEKFSNLNMSKFVNFETDLVIQSHNDMLCKLIFE